MRFQPHSPSEPLLPASICCTVRACLDREARGQPDAVFAVFASGEEWTWRELRSRVRRVATGLQRRGIGAGDTVVAWLPNSPESLLLLFAVNYLGAVFAPIGVESRGQLLDNALAAAAPKLAVVHASLLPRMSDTSRARIRDLVVAGGGALPSSATPFDALTQQPDMLDDAALADPAPWDVQALVATSGTTGPSKYVPITYAQTWATSEGFVALTASDRALLNIPMSHVGGIGVAMRALLRGGSVALVEAFSAATFWSTVRRLQVTTLTLLGAMTEFLLSEPASSADSDHPLRHVVMVPIAANAAKFAERFGVDVYTVFNMTEVSCPVVSERNALRVGSCGRVRAGYHARLVDEHDCQVPVGEIGEMILRADMPWAIATGYLNDAQATARAWRNGWFHTGDRFRQDAEGHFYFVDRLKDAIRRRGENVSAAEVEAALAGYRGMREVAVVGVASVLGEDEILAAFATVDGAPVDGPALVAYLADALPHFMVPRYFRQVQALPRTGSLKVQKHVLRAEGVTPDCWDREAAGLRLRRTRFDEPGKPS